MLRRGQIFTTDFVISLIVFMSVITLSFQVWNQSLQGKRAYSRKNTMQRKAYHTADLLTRTPGYPSDWNSSNVRVVGLASPDHLVREEKFLEMKKLEREEFRALNRLNPYSFYLKLSYNGSLFSLGGIGGGTTAIVSEEDNHMIDFLSQSGRTWDLYWGGGTIPETNARNVYENSTEILLEKAIENRSNYSTLVFFDPEIPKTRVDNSESLSEYLDNGNQYIQVGNTTLIEELGISPQEAPKSGLVDDKEVLQRGIDEGDTLEFVDPEYSFTSPETSYVSNSTECLVCSWREGKVFYISSNNLTSESSESLNLSESYTIKRWFFGTNSSYGKRFQDTASNIIPENRQVLLKTRERTRKANLRFVVWE